VADRPIYRFDEGSAQMRELLGGKGANLAEMVALGLPVPPGFTITTTVCKRYYQLGEKLPPDLMPAVREAMADLERSTGKSFGDPARPLLVSVRSGAAVSMPGMMDTILNLGLNDEVVEGLAEAARDHRFALDSYRRFIQMFGNVVLGIPHERFERVLAELKARAKVAEDAGLDEAHLRELIGEYHDVVKTQCRREFPQDPYLQLEMAIAAVFRSWNNHRARVYRKVHHIPDDLGTAVTVQCMVFGNMGWDSATGVVFSRNPATGERGMYGEYLLNAQGEDVVAGIRTPRPIDRMADDLPEAYRELRRAVETLERHYRDMQDVEFTVERGRLYLLQTRTAKRTAAAAVKVAVDLAREGIIDRSEALRRVDPDQLARLLHRTVDAERAPEPLAVGLPASPGAACGEVVMDADRAEALGQQGRAVILVRPETTPDDMHGIVQAQGILTSRGGMTCHAAIVARGMGKPCVVGCDALSIDLVDRTARIGGITIREGDLISIDGATGRVYLGEVPMVEPRVGGEFRLLLDWAREFRRLGVRANADTPEDARRAREFGAEGIGLCRTEHMFMAPDRLPVVQEMILASTREERQRALDRLRVMQEEDFYRILKEMDGLPVTIRLLDPPLHEFLPDVEELAREVAEAAAQGHEGPEVERKRELLRKARALAEFNPMLGFRGCRLGIVYPEIYRMQAEAIFRATARLLREGRHPRPEVMIPLVAEARELKLLREVVAAAAERVGQLEGVEVPAVVGTMIEVPRAALTAAEIAEYAEFFSFGTNDLTQTTFGFSRDDAEAKFLHHYVHRSILPHNPFAVLDEAGVGRLIRLAVEEGRSARPDLKIGICGEHGGEPRSILFCHRVGLDYVSCSPFRVPVALLAAAQAALEGGRCSC